MVKYVYDAWGNHVVEVLDSACAELSQLNPYRYRGYYYDTETGLYFLKTRYYDPEVGRFITIDDLSYIDPETINGLNLYAYCTNNPVMNIDPNGTWSWKKFWKRVAGIGTIVASVAIGAVGAVLMATGVGAGVGAILLGAGIGGFVSATSNLVSQGLSNGWGNIDYGAVAINGLAGMATGAIMASPLGAVATGVAVGGIGFAQSVANDLYESGGNFSNVNWGIAVLQGIVGGVISGVGRFMVRNSSIMNKFVNSSKYIQSLGEQSANLGLVGRNTYIAYWKNVMILQAIYQKGLTFLTSILRSGIKNLINLIG